MTKKNSSGTGMFMMEMIMVVFCFILCASTCILVFVKSNQMSSYAKGTNQGVLVAESIAEVWKAEGGEGLVQRFYATTPGGIALDTHEYRMFWDKNWNVTDQSKDATYQAEIVWKEVDGLANGTVRVSEISGSRGIFTMSVSKYQAVP